MRLDVDVPNPLNYVVKIFLDGVEQSRCLVADEEQGYIVRYALTSDGHYKINPRKRSEILRETIRGKVEIVIPQETIDG